MQKLINSGIATLALISLPVTPLNAQSSPAPKTPAVQTPVPPPSTSATPVPPVANTADPDAFCFIVSVVIAGRLRNNPKVQADPQGKKLLDDVNESANFYAGRLNARMAPKDAGTLLKTTLGYSVSRDKSIADDMADCLRKKSAFYGAMMEGFGAGK